MLTNDLQQVWGEWLATAENLVQKMHEQTVGVTLRDFERIHRLQPEIAALLARLTALESEADSMVRHLGEVVASGTSLAALAKTLEQVEARQLLGLANRVSAESRVIGTLVEKNNRLISEKLGMTQATSVDIREFSSAKLAA
jgi:hypothetical protein